MEMGKRKNLFKGYKRGHVEVPENRRRP